VLSDGKQGGIDINTQANKTVLVADDEPSIRALVNKYLGEYVVLEAEDGAQALEAAQAYNPDLILLDIMMPKIDGYTVCQRLKADPLTNGIPIVMLTGLGFSLNVKLGQSLGADAYITKPFGEKELKAAIDKLLPCKALDDQ
jgi:CheY-like chemotaxis protein